MYHENTLLSEHDKTILKNSILYHGYIGIILWHFYGKCLKYVHKMNNLLKMYIFIWSRLHGNTNVREYVNHLVHKQLTNSYYITYKNWDVLRRVFGCLPWCFVIFLQVLCCIIYNNYVTWISIPWEIAYIPSLYQCALCNGFHACFNCRRYHGTIMSFDLCYDTTMVFFKVLWCIM